MNDLFGIGSPRGCIGWYGTSPSARHFLVVNSLIGEGECSTDIVQRNPVPEIRWDSNMGVALVCHKSDRFWVGMVHLPHLRATRNEEHHMVKL